MLLGRHPHESQLPHKRINIVILGLKQLCIQGLNSLENTQPIHDTLSHLLGKQENFSLFRYYLDEKGTMGPKALTEQVL